MGPFGGGPQRWVDRDRQDGCPPKRQPLGCKFWSNHVNRSGDADIRIGQPVRIHCSEVWTDRHQSVLLHAWPPSHQSQENSRSQTWILAIDAAYSTSAGCQQVSLMKLYGPPPLPDSQVNGTIACSSCRTESPQQEAHRLKLSLAQYNGFLAIARTSFVETEPGKA